MYYVNKLVSIEKQDVANFMIDYLREDKTIKFERLKTILTDTFTTLIKAGLFSKDEIDSILRDWIKRK